MPKTRAKNSFVVCLSSDGYAASLEPRKIYVALRDSVAAPRALRAAVAAAWAAAGLGGGRLSRSHCVEPECRRSE